MAIVLCEIGVYLINAIFWEWAVLSF